MEKNPFEVLGISPSIIRKLNDFQIIELAKAQYRTLAGFYHPDKGGTNENFSEITSAYQILNSDKETYKFWKKEHLKGLKKKLTDLEKKLQTAREENVSLTEKIRDYMTEYAFGYNVFCSAPRTFIMNDYAQAINLSMFTKSQAQKNLLFYTLRVRGNGSIEKDRNGEKQVFENRRLIGAIDYNESREYEGILCILRKAQAIWTPAQENSRMRLAKQEGASSPRKPEIYEGRIPAKEFEKIIPYLKPRINRMDYVFSIDKDKDIYFNLEGSVVKEV